MLNASSSAPQRPVSITILAALCLLTGVATVVVLAVWLVSPAALQAYIDLEIPSTVPVWKIALALIYSAVWILCGVGLLTGANWARPLTLAYALLAFLKVTGMSAAELMIEAVWLLLIMWLLFRSKSERWFKSRRDAQPASAS